MTTTPAAPPLCNYYSVGDNSPTTSVWDLAAGGLVAFANATFQAWLGQLLAAGAPYYPFVLDLFSASSADAGASTSFAVYSTAGMTTGVPYNFSGTSGLYDGIHTITVVDATHVKIAVAFAGSTTGLLAGAGIVATQAGLYSIISDFNSRQWATVPLANSLTFAGNGSITVAQLAKFLSITNTSGGAITISMPNTILPGSVPPGAIVRIRNVSGGGTVNTINVQNTSAALASGPIQPNSFLDVTFTATNPTNDGFTVCFSSNVSFGALTPPPAGQLLVGQTPIAGASYAAWSATPTLGVVGTTQGQLKLAGSVAGILTLQGVANITTYTWSFPQTGGTNTYALTTDGTGGTTWSQIALGSAVTGTLPVANGGTNYTGGTWTTYTATLTIDAGTPTQGGSAAYLQIGKIVMVHIAVSLSFTGGPPTNVTIALPVAVKRNLSIIGAEVMNTGQTILAKVNAGSATSITIRKVDGSVRAPANNDEYDFCAIYEAN